MGPKDLLPVLLTNDRRLRALARMEARTAGASMATRDQDTVAFHARQAAERYVRRARAAARLQGTRPPTDDEVERFARRYTAAFEAAWRDVVLSATGCP